MKSAKRLVDLRKEITNNFRVKDHVKDGMISYDLEINAYISMVDWAYNFMQEYEITKTSEIVELFLADLKEEDSKKLSYNAEEVNLLNLLIGLIIRGRKEGVNIKNYDAFREIILGDIKERFEKIKVTDDGMCSRSQTAGEKSKLTRRYVRIGNRFITSYLMHQVIDLRNECN